jgi:hypothetical protein
MAIEIKSKGLNNLPEIMAERFYNLHQKIIFQRISFSKTSLVPKLWTDLAERDRLEYVESFRQLLADQQLMNILVRRADL